MHDQIAPRIAKWPFLVGDVLLLVSAYLIYSHTTARLNSWEVLGCVLCVIAGAVLAVIPFMLDYRAQMKLVEASGLATVVSQISNVEQVASQISHATSQWQTVRDAADKTATAARGIAEGMAGELKSFSEFMQRANDGEKATLRLETEKLRRAELEWLQVVIRMLDHVFALNQAAQRSQQARVAEQVANFQKACLDSARRVGLIPFVPTPNEAFNQQRHQAMDGDAESATGTLIQETLAAGYTFQGNLVRPALVRLQNGTGQVLEPEPSSEAAPSAEPMSDQRQLFRS